MDLKEIAQLLELIDGADIEEFELERDGVRIRVRKGQGREAGGHTQVSRTAPPAGRGEVSSPAEAETPPVEKENLHVFTSPIVGTFYITPKPDAEPLVRSGDSVSVGTNLCIIEAMKIFNTIESDVEGTVVRILVENGQPVEFGEGLFEIRISS
jgi:acetyl-CoA carboxylase biotin carboxyl carrier protein